MLDPPGDSRARELLKLSEQVDPAQLSEQVDPAQHRRLGPVLRLVDRPRVLTGAQRGGVADPPVRGEGPGVAAVQAVLAPAEALHGHVLRGEHQRDSRPSGVSP